MARISVGFHPAAGQEAEAAYDWYAARDPNVANAFRDELQHAVEAVGRSPLTWPRHGRGTRRYVFPRYPFSLIYRLRDDQAEILAVAHAKRRPGYWRSRL